MRKLLVVLAAALMGAVADSPAEGQEGLLLVVNKSESTLSFVHAPSRTEVAEVETGFAPHEVALSPDGRWAYVSDYGTGPEPGNTVTIVDVAEIDPSLHGLARKYFAPQKPAKASIDNFTS